MSQRITFGSLFNDEMTPELCCTFAADFAVTTIVLVAGIIDTKIKSKCEYLTENVLL